MSGIRLGESWTFTATGVATQTFGVLAVRGAGKSNLAAVMAEEMHRLGIPFVVVDPVGSWWGLRSSTDGKSAGLDVLIFGGRHGDVPLEKTGGQVLADLVVDDRVSCVLDVSEFSEGEKTRFLTDFAERLYRRNTDPLHLFLEEADDYAPQRPMREQPRLLHAWENIVRRGRARGLGMTMITQRSAALNKNVLTQIETLFVLRTTSPQDRKAIEGWIESHGESKEVIASLPSLGPGEAWVWSPQWLRTMKRIQVRRRTTFDSGATPKEGRGARPAAKLADVDLGAVREKMAATIERAKQEDPKELRKRIQQLERELATRKVETETVSAISPDHLERLEKLVGDLGRGHGLALDVANTMSGVASRVTAAIAATKPSPQPAVTMRTKVLGATVPRTDTTRQLLARGAAGLGRGELLVLTAIAQHPAGVSPEQLTVLTGFKRSTRNTYLQRLRAAELIDRGGHGFVVTPAGLGSLGPDYEPLPTGRALAEHWLTQLGGGEQRILQLLLDNGSMAPDAISAETGYERSSRNTYLQRLAARRLIVREHGSISVSKELIG